MKVSLYRTLSAVITLSAALTSCAKRDFHDPTTFTETYDVEACLKTATKASNALDANITCLNEYVRQTAIPRSEARLREQNFSAPELSKIYTVEVCDQNHFARKPTWLPWHWLDVLGVWNELETGSQTAKFINQIDGTLRFLEITHKAMEGVPIGWFDTVVVCPRKWRDSDGKPPLQLYSGHLFVWMVEKVGGYEVQNENNLLEDWNTMNFQTDIPNESEFFGRFNKTIRKLWRVLINPISSMRVAYRKGITDEARHAREMLEGFRMKTEDRAQTLSTLLSFADASAFYRDALKQRVADLSDERLKCVASSLESALEDPSAWKKADNCASAIIANQVKQSVSVKDVGVYVGNLHSIGVGLTSCDSSYERHAIPSTIDKRDEFKRVAVVVNTIDEVNVTVNINNFMFPALLERTLLACK